MGSVRVKQLSYLGAPEGESCVTYDGTQVLWQRIRYTATFDSSSLESDNTVSVAHTLGRKFVQVSFFDETDTRIFPDTVQLLDDNSFKVDFSSFIDLIDAATANGKNWTVVVT